MAGVTFRPGMSDLVPIPVTWGNQGPALDPPSR